MFWFGLIVGMCIALGAVSGYIFYIIHKHFVSTDEFWEACEVVGGAVCDRESEIQVWHDGEMVDQIALEEL